MTDQEYIRAIKATWDEPQEDEQFDGDAHRDDLEGIGEHDDEPR